MYDSLALSVWSGDDQSFLDQALDFYPCCPVRSILDCTFNTGRFWKKSRFRSCVVSMDFNPKYKPDIVDDNTVMSTVPDSSFDVVVYDPPHVPNQGKDKTKDFCERFGLGRKSGKGHFSDDHFAVMKQVSRVLKPGGICLSKVADYVHNHCYQWVLVDLVQAIRSAAMTPCDLVVKVRKNPIMDPKWKNRHHVRKCHCYWVISRNSSSCERNSIGI